MSYEDKILDKFADMIMPPGTIIAYQGIEAPEGFIVYDHIKIYEDEFPRLYPVLAANPNFNKGADSDGRKWVELPEIDDLCIQMTTDTSQVGKTLEAQLPNMHGTIGWSDVGLYSVVNGSFRGDLRGNEDASADWSQPKSDNTKYKSATLDLSLGSSIYSGSKLQPNALHVLACIRC